MTSLSQLISHRFRGFSKHENSTEGLNNALTFGVDLVEFDVRIAKCGTPMVYHDEFAYDSVGKKRYLCDIIARDFPSLGGVFAHIPTLSQILEVAASHSNQSCKLLIDIKDAGFEEEIHALVMEYRLLNRTVFVSWLPEVLYRLHNLAPQTPLCLSHWCNEPGENVRAFHNVFESINGEIPRTDRIYIHGERSGWYINGSLKGELRQILKSSRGSVCVPQSMLTSNLVEEYHRDSIAVSAFSYVTLESIQAHARKFNIDFYFIDNKDVFNDI